MNGIGARRLDHVAIDVTDVDRAKAFYGGLLGLREIPRPTSFTFGGAWYEIGAIRPGNGTPDILHLVSRAETFPPAPHHFCLWVNDVYAASKTIAAAGFEVIWDTRFKIPGIDRFFTRDPDGNRVEFQGMDKMAATEAAQVVTGSHRAINRDRIAFFAQILLESRAFVR